MWGVCVVAEGEDGAPDVDAGSADGCGVGGIVGE